jgi:hypothetical protein
MCINGEVLLSMLLRNLPKLSSTLFDKLYNLQQPNKLTPRFPDRQTLQTPLPKDLKK